MRNLVNSGRNFIYSIEINRFAIEYEFSERFVNIRKLMGPQKSVSYIRGSECDIRIKSSRESVHYIHSPNVSNCINSVYNRINLSFLSSQSFTQRTQLALIFWMVFRYFIFQVILFLSVVPKEMQQVLQQATYILNLSILFFEQI